MEMGIVIAYPHLASMERKVVTTIRLPSSSIGRVSRRSVAHAVSRWSNNYPARAARPTFICSIQ